MRAADAAQRLFISLMLSMLRHAYGLHTQSRALSEALYVEAHAACVRATMSPRLCFSAV